MSFTVSGNHVEFDLDMIVRAIEKAIGEDVPNQLREHHLETNNYIGLMRGDFINENLRNFALADGYELIPIQRYGWRGRLLVKADYPQYRDSGELTYDPTQEASSPSLYHVHPQGAKR